MVFSMARKEVKAGRKLKEGNGKEATVAAVCISEGGLSCAAIDIRVLHRNCFRQIKTEGAGQNAPECRKEPECDEGVSAGDIRLIIL